MLEHYQMMMDITGKRSNTCNTSNIITYSDQIVGNLGLQQHRRCCLRSAISDPDLGFRGSPIPCTLEQRAKARIMNIDLNEKTHAGNIII
jgi:hypothetical protein